MPQRHRHDNLLLPGQRGDGDRTRRDGGDTVYDAFGNIAQVIEPDPNAGNVTTSYTYNALGLITRVEMPRGGVTQVRTFSYNSAAV